MKYEIRPTMNLTPTEVTVCHESEAEQWSLYERQPPDESGFSPSVWIADFAREVDAIEFAKLLRANV